MKFSEDKILEQLNRINTDKAFSRSKINVRLLQFLVRATLADKDIKEMTIGTEFFGPKYDPVKSDNKVRVYIYHLRKKLDEYYNAAPASEIVFSITKGQYKVQFESYKKPEKKKSKVNYLSYIALIILSVIALLTFVITKPINPFWKSLMQNKLNTTVVFGDYFTIEGPISTSKKGIIRDYDINSEKELKSYLKEHPEQADQLQASKHHYFNWMAPHCSKNITEFWSDYNYPFEIIQISEWSVSELEKENLVYFGQSKSMGVLKSILLDNFPHFSYKSQRLVRTDPITKEKVTYSDIVRYNDKIIDYTVVAKITMPTGNEMRFFLSDQDCGAISALQYFTQNDSVTSFYERHNLQKSDDFIVLFKVTGWLRKSYDMEFVVLDKK